MGTLIDPYAQMTIVPGSLSSAAKNLLEKRQPYAAYRAVRWFGLQSEFPNTDGTERDNGEFDGFAKINGLWSHKIALTVCKAERRFIASSNRK